MIRFLLASLLSLVVGPWVTNMSEEGFSVLWTTDTDCIAWVQLEDGTRVYDEFAGRRGYGRLHHVKIRIPDAAGKRVGYSIGTCDVTDDSNPRRPRYAEEVSGGTYSVKLFSSREKTCRFSVINDMHKHTHRFARLASQIDTSGTDFIFLNGDLISAGHHPVDSLAKYEIAPLGRRAAVLPVMFARGNHEGRGDGIRNVAAIFPVAPGKTGDELPFNYTFREGPAAFLVLDGGETGAANSVAFCGKQVYEDYLKAQTEWIREVTKDPKWKNAPVKICLLHVPMLDFGIPDDYLNHAWMNHNMIPVLNKAGVDLMIGADLHEFQFHPAGEMRNDFPILVNDNHSRTEVSIDGKHISINVYPEQEPKPEINRPGLFTPSGYEPSPVTKAFSLAVRTVEDNIEDGIIKAGGDYGGEWTRDASINAWNAGSLLFPVETDKSLWAVTEDDGSRIGHQYWDKIIWTLGARNHSLVTGAPVEKIYRCCATTMKELEDTVYVASRGLFRGPSVFNDGIAGYEYPIPNDSVYWSSVLWNPATFRICCLSTNCIYYWSYRCLAEMALECGEPIAALGYRLKGARLRRHIRRTFYDSKSGRLAYLVDQNGDIHNFQEALGWSFAVMSGVLTHREAVRLASNVHVSEYGITSIYPDFKRFDSEHPGRHNNILWPFVNAFWACAALQCDAPDQFVSEVRNLAGLAMRHNMFYEIYNPVSGEPDGGWQVGHQWNSCRNQTWSATGYMRMILQGVFGIGFTRRGMTIEPDVAVADALGCTNITGLKYRGHKVSVEILPATDGNPTRSRQLIYVNGHRVRRAVIPCTGTEDYFVQIMR